MVTLPALPVTLPVTLPWNPPVENIEPVAKISPETVNVLVGLFVNIPTTPPVVVCTELFVDAPM